MIATAHRRESKKPIIVEATPSQNELCSILAQLRAVNNRNPIGPILSSLTTESRSCEIVLAIVPPAIAASRRNEIAR